MTNINHAFIGTITAVTGLIMSTPLLFAEESAQDLAGLHADFAVFAEQHCYRCHDANNAEAELDLEAIMNSSAGFAGNTEALELVYDAVDFEDMPPPQEKQPTDDERTQAIDNILAIKDILESRTLNDPGLVVMPRITRAEYDRIIRDLTGREGITVSHILPDEGGAGEGFSNVGEAHSVSIMQIEKYLDAARTLVEHLIATPDGWYWAKARVKKTNDEMETVENMKSRLKWRYVELETSVRKKPFEQIEAQVSERFDNDRHKRNNWHSVLYLEAAWSYLHRQALDLPEDDLDAIAKSIHPLLQGGVLEDFITVLSSAGSPEVSPHLTRHVAKLNELPGPDGFENREELQEQLWEIYESWTAPPRNSQAWRQRHAPEYEVSFEGVGDMQDDLKKSRWPFRIDLNHKDGFEELYLITTEAADGNEGDLAEWVDGQFLTKDGEAKPWDEALKQAEVVEGDAQILNRDGKTIISAKPPMVLRLPIPEGADFLEVTARVPGEAVETATLQVLIENNPPSDRELIYYPNRHLLGHWKENAAVEEWIDKIVDAVRIFNEDNNNILDQDREPFQFLSEETLNTLEIRGMKEKLAEQEQDDAKFPYFFTIPELREIASESERADLEKLEFLMTGVADRIANGEPAEQELRKAAREQVHEFMVSAWRRHVSEAELEEIMSLYDQEREAGAHYEKALKQAVTGVLMSPYFIYRYPVKIAEHPADAEIVPLTSPELASRLSFALWASIPDRELLDLAEADKLRDPQVLLQQARRMLQDPRAAAMSEEFAAQWFRFANFDQFSEPDSQLFPDFTPEIAEAMYEEMRLFFLDMVQNNRPITNVLDADYTFLNEKLAEYYGMEDLEIEGSEMRLVKLNSSHRGGVVTMGAPLTRNSAAQRTSPVKRGVWVYEEILGGHIPNPPAVPPLSDGERNENGLTIVEQLAAHRDNPTCYSCHAKFDAFGIALENFDAVGRWRETDSAGEPLATEDELSNGTRIDGVEALRAYLLANEEQFLEHFCRKLLGYMLGRGVALGDRPLMEEMKSALKENNYQFESALTVILQSRQFLNRRVQEDLEDTSVDAGEPQDPAETSS